MSGPSGRKKRWYEEGSGFSTTSQGPVVFGVDDSDLLIAVSNSDGANVLACHTGKQLGAKTTIASSATGLIRSFQAVAWASKSVARSRSRAISRIRKYLPKGCPASMACGGMCETGCGCVLGSESL